MAGTILTRTQQPVMHNSFSFGGDDTGLGKTGFFAKVVEWDRDPQGDSFKATFVFFIKKSFAFLDTVGIGMCFYGITGFTGQLSQCEVYQAGPERNRQARVRIITALGGEAVCTTIPVVQFQPDNLTDYLKLGDNYFSRGQSIVQGEDSAGRKFVLLRLADRTGRIVIATIHQRYRETSISSSGGGGIWTSNFSGGSTSSVDVSVNQAVELIQKVKNRQHQEFVLAPKV